MDMSANKWIHTATQTELSSNTILGTPRSWLSRSVGHKFAELAGMNSILTHHGITLGGIWFRPADLPVTETWPCLYRFFRLSPDFYRTQRARTPVSAIGIAVMVPADQILETRRRFIAHGAEWTWWAMPETSQGTKTSEPQRRNTIDHAEMYNLFEQGMDARAAADFKSLPFNSVVYVYRKWQAGLSSEKLRAGRGRPVDPKAIIEDIRADQLGMSEIALKHHTTRTTVWKIKNKYL